MKRLRFFTLALALCMLFLPLLSCNEETEPPVVPPAQEAPEEEPGEETPQTLALSSVRKDIAKYTVVRPETNDALVDAAVLICTVSETKTGIYPDIATDYEAVDASVPEILVGDTARAESAEAKQQLTEKMPYLITQVGSKICIVGHTANDVINGVNEFLAVYFSYDVPGLMAYHDVRQYGAVGDGKTDDTFAFEDAIKAAEKDGLPVYVPAGAYLITNMLELNSVTLYGYSSGAWTADGDDLPVVYHNNPEEPLFNVIGGSLSGLHIQVQGINENTTEGVETVRLTRPGSRVGNLKISNPYNAIATYYREGDSNPGRCFIENIFIIQCWNTGVSVSDTYDVATVLNIEVWNPNMEYSCPVAFKFGHNDDIRCVNLFAFNADTGFLLEETREDRGGFWGSLTNCSVDFTAKGIRVGTGKHHVTVVGGTYWGHHYGLEVLSSTSDETLVTFTGCEVKTNGANPISISGGQMVTISGCNLQRTMAGHSADPIVIKGGRGVTITGCSIATTNKAITFTNSFKGAAVFSNNCILTGASNPDRVISNVAANKDNIVISGNAILTEQTFE